GAAWHEDRFTFEALRAAIEDILNRLSHHIPSEPNQPPERLMKETENFNPRLWHDPVEVGRFVAFSVWRELKQEKPRLSDLLHDVFYTLAYVRERLNIPMEWDASHRY